MWDFWKGDIRKFCRKKLWKFVEICKTKKGMEVKNKLVKSNAQTPMHFTVCVSFPIICRSDGCVEPVTPILVTQWLIFALSIWSGIIGTFRPIAWGLEYIRLPKCYVLQNTRRRTNSKHFAIANKSEQFKPKFYISYIDYDTNLLLQVPETWISRRRAVASEVNYRNYKNSAKLSQVSKLFVG